MVDGEKRTGCGVARGENASEELPCEEVALDTSRTDEKEDAFVDGKAGGDICVVSFMILLSVVVG